MENLPIYRADGIPAAADNTAPYTDLGLTGGVDDITLIQQSNITIDNQTGVDIWVRSVSNADKLANKRATKFSRRVPAGAMFNCRKGSGLRWLSIYCDTAFTTGSAKIIVSMGDGG